MKLSDDFDSRRLRPRKPHAWRRGIAVFISIILFLNGLLCIVAGSAAVLGKQLIADVSIIEPSAGAVLLVLGLILFGIGMLIWRTVRRRTRYTNELSLAPELMKKHH